MGQGCDATSIWPLNDDLFSIKVAARLERQGHPALVMRDGRSVRRKKLERTAKPIHGVVEFRCPTPDFFGKGIEVRDQALGVARVRAGGQVLQKASELYLALASGRNLFTLHFNSLRAAKNYPSL
jgi:hypothetical protein